MSQFTHEPDNGIKDWLGRTHQERIDDLKSEIADSEAELLTLFALDSD